MPRRIPMFRLFRLFAISLLLLLLIVPAAFADVPAAPTHTLLFPQAQLFAFFFGMVSTAVSYILNRAVIKKLIAGVPEPILGLVHILVAAAGAAIYEASQTNSFGWNATTLQLILTAVVASFAAHGLIYKPTGLQAVLTGSKAGGSHRNVH